MKGPFKILFGHKTWDLEGGSNWPPPSISWFSSTPAGIGLSSYYLFVTFYHSDHLDCWTKEMHGNGRSELDLPCATLGPQASTYKKEQIGILKCTTILKILNWIYSLEKWSIVQTECVFLILLLNLNIIW